MEKMLSIWKIYALFIYVKKYQSKKNSLSISSFLKHYFSRIKPAAHRIAMSDWFTTINI